MTMKSEAFFLKVLSWIRLLTAKLPIIHSEILGFNMPQRHQYHISRAHFEAEPHNQPEANKWLIIFCLLSRSNLNDFVVTDNTSFPRSGRYTEVGGWHFVIYAWFELLWKYSKIFFPLINHLVWLCVSKAVCLWCCLPLEPKPFPKLTVIRD